MSLTKAQVREILSRADTPADKLKEAVDDIISGHTSSIEALREERDKLREDVDKYKDFEAKYNDTKKELDEAQKKIDGEKDYDKLKADFDAYKKQISDEKNHSAKESAYKKVLSELGITDKRVSAILKVSDISKIDLGKDGEIKNKDDLSKSLREEWAEFIPKEHQQGAKTANPTSNTGGSKMTKEEILAIKDTVARQKAMAENFELFEN
jgi:hypothetical protein